MRAVVRVVALVAPVALTACKDAAKPRRDDGPTPGAAARLLRYQPENIGGYQLAASGGTAPGALVPFEIARTIELDVEAEDERRLSATVHEADPYAVYDLGDAEGASVLLFPELPAEPVAPGRRWTVARAVTVHGVRVDLSHELRYAGDAACPSGARLCAQLAIAAPARNVIVRVDTESWIATYSFTGTVAIDRERGSVDESRLRVIGSVANGPANVPLDVTLVATPLGPPLDARD